MLRNPLSLTVVFPQPSESIVGTYQLACHRGEAHAIVMPNVTDTLLVRFLADYLGWWRSAPRSAADGRGSRRASAGTMPGLTAPTWWSGGPAGRSPPVTPPSAAAASSP